MTVLLCSVFSILRYKEHRNILYLTWTGSSNPQLFRTGPISLTTQLRILPPTLFPILLPLLLPKLYYSLHYSLRYSLHYFPNYNIHYSLYCSLHYSLHYSRCHFPYYSIYYSLHYFLYYSLCYPLHCSLHYRFSTPCTTPYATPGILRIRWILQRM